MKIKDLISNINTSKESPPELDSVNFEELAEELGIILHEMEEFDDYSKHDFKSYPVYVDNNNGRVFSIFAYYLGDNFIAIKGRPNIEYINADQYQWVSKNTFNRAKRYINSFRPQYGTADLINPELDVNQLIKEWKI